MKALLVLALSVAVQARPEPGFAYSVVDPGQGYAATPANMYSSMYASKYAVANPYMYQMYRMYGLNVPMVYNPVVYQAPACHNNDGQVVPCAGVDGVVPVAAPVEQRQAQVVAPQAPAAPAIAPATSGQTGIVSVKKREADPLYYYNGVSPVYSHVAQPAVYTNPAVYSTPVVYSHPTPVVYSQPNPVVYSQPMVYTPTVGCRNNEGKHVACIGEPEVKSEPAPEAVPEAVAEAKTVEAEPTALEAAAAVAKIFAVKKREAEPEAEAEADPAYFYSTVTPGQAYNPLMYTNPLMYSMYANPMYANSMYANPMYANVPVVYQAGGCRNDMGYLVPCAYGNNVVTPIALSAVPAVAPQAVATPVAVEQKSEAVPAEGVISVKKREAESKSGPLYYGDTYKFPGYRAYTDISQVAVPTRYTVSEPIVKTVGQPVVAAAAYDAPLTTIAKTVYSAPIVSTSYVTSPVAATSYVAPVPVAAAPVPVGGCRNEQGSIVPCA